VSQCGVELEEMKPLAMAGFDVPMADPRGLISAGPSSTPSLNQTRPVALRLGGAQSMILEAVATELDVDVASMQRQLTTLNSSFEAWSGRSTAQGRASALHEATVGVVTQGITEFWVTAAEAKDALESAAKVRFCGDLRLLKRVNRRNRVFSSYLHEVAHFVVSAETPVPRRSSDRGAPVVPRRCEGRSRAPAGSRGGGSSGRGGRRSGGGRGGGSSGGSGSSGDGSGGDGPQRKWAIRWSALAALAGVALALHAWLAPAPAMQVSVQPTATASATPTAGARGEPEGKAR
jgi:hypothetical protein